MSTPAAAAAAAPTLPPLPDTAQLSPRVLTVLGQNPGMMTLQGTNTYIVGTGKSRILIDTGEGVPAWATNLRALLAEHGCTSLSAILLTHWHHDHVGGLVDVHDLLTPPPPSSSSSSSSSSSLTAAAVPTAAAAAPIPLNFGVFKSHGSEFLATSLCSRLSSLNIAHDGGGLKVQPISDGQIFRTEGATLTALATPGHTEDHMSFLLQEEGAIFSGDTILGAGTAVFSDLHSYLHSLRLIHSHGPRRIYPAHGSTIDNDPIQRIEQYIAHRSQREEQIVGALKEQQITLATLQDEKQREAQYYTALELVQKIYVDLPASLQIAAANNVLLHLGKLEKEGRVQPFPAPADNSSCDRESQVNKSHQQHVQSPAEETSPAADDDDDCCQSEVAKALAIAAQRAHWRWKLL